MNYALSTRVVETRNFASLQPGDVYWEFVRSLADSSTAGVATTKPNVTNLGHFCRIRFCSIYTEGKCK
ncbi:MAG: hypothetical protein KME54_06340 [Tolypothrix brevis GSE-NOS-MK-07-07A]|nr:hypothetical protein [Tolypothrix brevis GSE-NOS-MK-07-07A]